MTKQEIKEAWKALELERKQMKLKHQLELAQWSHKVELIRLECDHSGAYHGRDRSGCSESQCYTCGYST